MAKNNLYVRVKPKSPVKEFWRCGILFTVLWVLKTDLDDATAQRLKEEQILETSDNKPDGFDAQEALAAQEAKEAEIARHGDDGLIGSGILPSVITVADGAELSLGELVQDAFKASHLSVEGWNGLPQSDREKILQGKLDHLQAGKAAENTHQQALITANQTVEDLRTQVNTLNSKVSSITSERDILQGKVTSHETTISTLTNDKGGLQTQVSTLQGQVTKLEGELATAKAAANKPAGKSTAQKKAE